MESLPQFTYIKKCYGENTHAFLNRSAMSLASGSFFLKTMAPDIPLRHVVDLDQTIFLPVGSATCPFLFGHIFVHFVLKGTFLHGIIAKNKFCVPLVLSLPPLPLSSGNIVIRGNLKKGRTTSDSDKSLRRFYVLVFLSYHEEDPCSGCMVQQIFDFITTLDKVCTCNSQR